MTRSVFSIKCLYGISKLKCHILHQSLYMTTDEFQAAHADHLGRASILDFLLLVELFRRCYTAEAPRAKIDRKSAISPQLKAVSLTQNFRWKWSPPPIIFARIVRPMNALHLCRRQFSHNETLYSRLSSSEVRFYTEKGRFAFSSPPPPPLRA